MVQKHSDNIFLRLLIFIVLLLACIGSFSVFFIHSRFFQIQEIQLTGDAYAIELNEDITKKNIFLFPADEIRQQILRDYPLIKTIGITKKYPHTLFISITLRKPIASLYTDSYYFGIDNEGFITSLEKVQDVPVIAINADPIHKGERVANITIGQVLKFIQYTREFIRPSLITIFDRSSFVAKVEQSDILFPQEEDLRSISDTLQILIGGFRIKGIMPKVIDLRYSKPVVRF